MNKLFLYFVLFIFALTSGVNCTHQSKILLKFSNSLNINREKEVIVFENKELTNLIGEFPVNKIPLFISGNDTLIVQFVDLNSDKIPEEILVEISLKPKENKEVKVKFISPEKYPVFPQKTNLRFAAKSDLSTELQAATRVQTDQTKITSTVFQMEGPAWENDKVGFRNYFDLRNGMDIFGKKVSEMVLDSVGLGQSYHEISDWGMDILIVGNSLGAGAVGIEKDGKLYRIGNNGNGTFERMYEGPLRTEFRLDFPDWEMESKEYFITHYISITAGQYAYKNNIFASGLPESAYIISGMVNKMSDELFIENSDGYICLYTHAKQAADSAYLSMALLIPEKYFTEEGEASEKGQEINETYYAKMGLYGQKETVYYFYALWENSDKRFSDVTYVKDFLRQEARKLNNPVNISRIR